MKLNKNILPTILLGGLLIGLSLLSQEEVGNRFLLPEDFKVYAGNHGVVNHPVQGLTEKTLTTRNLFQKTPGCYIACYSRDPEKGIYSVGDGIFVMGQIRVKGKYDERVANPINSKTKTSAPNKNSKIYVISIFPIVSRIVGLVVIPVVGSGFSDSVIG